jgi:thiol-disulfide isomerase/thioredoxin
MRSGPSTFLLFVLLLLLLSMGCPGGTSETGSRRGVAWPATRRAPVDLVFQDPLTGRELRLSDHRGKPVVLLFFTTWCRLCQLQAERLHQVHAAVGRDRVVLLGVALDVDQRLVAPFVEAAGFNFPVVLGDPALVRGSPIGPVTGVPRIVILDAAGRPVADFAQPVEGKPIYRSLRSLLRR